MAKYKSLPVKNTVMTAFDNAKSEVDSLAEEMREWCDKMEENEGLAATQKHDEVSEAADTLEQIQSTLDDAEGEFNDDWFKEKYAKTEVNYVEAQPYKGKGYPRWMRASNASAALGAVKEYLEGIEEKMEESDPHKDYMSTMIQHLDDITGELDNVSFPGMF